MTVDSFIIIAALDSVIFIIVYAVDLNILKFHQRLIKLNF